MIGLAFRAGYALIAAGFLYLGVAFVFGPYGLLPEAWASIATTRAGGDPDFLHAIHETGALLLALGGSALWAAFDLRRSLPIHLLLALSCTWIAVVHVFDVRPIPVSVASRLGWSLPAVLLVLSYRHHPARPTRRPAIDSSSR